MTQNNSEKLSKFSWLIAVIGLLLTAFTTWQVNQLNQNSAIHHIASTADQIAAKMEERLISYALVLKGGAGLFDASGTVTRQEWQKYTSKLQASQAISSLTGINFAKYLSPEALNPHIAEIRNQGFSGYNVWPSGKRDRYSAIVFLNPFSGNNLQAFGYDMYSDPTRKAAMQQAADTGRATLSGKVTLKIENETQIQAGTLMYVPVYRKAAPIATIEQRQQALIGWVHSAYRMNDFMQDMLSDWPQLPTQHIGVTLYHNIKADAQRLYASHAQPSSPANSDFFQQRIIHFHDQQWLLTLDALQPSLIVDHTSSWVTFITGLILTALLFFLFQSISRTRSRAVLLAKQLSEQLTTIASRIPGMVYEYRLSPNGHGCFPYASSGIQQIYQLSHQQVQHDDARVRALIHPDDMEAVLRTTHHSAATLTPWRHEYRIRLKMAANVGYWVMPTPTKKLTALSAGTAS